MLPHHVTMEHWANSVAILFTVLKDYYIVSACKKLGITNCNDIPPKFPSIKSREENYAFITKLARQVVADTMINADSLLGTRSPI